MSAQEKLTKEAPKPPRIGISRNAMIRPDAVMDTTLDKMEGLSPAELVQIFAEDLSDMQVAVVGIRVELANMNGALTRLLTQVGNVVDRIPPDPSRWSKIEPSPAEKKKEEQNTPNPKLDQWRDSDRNRFANAWGDQFLARDTCSNTTLDLCERGVTEGGWEYRTYPNSKWLYRRKI